MTLDLGRFRYITVQECTITPWYPPCSGGTMGDHHNTPYLSSLCPQQYRQIPGIHKYGDRAIIDTLLSGREKKHAHLRRTSNKWQDTHISETVCRVVFNLYHILCLFN